MITGKNYIGSKLKADGTKTYKTINPQLNIENPWTFTEATPEEIDEAVALANDAFKVYRNCPAQKKADFLNAIAEEILALGDELLEVYCTESGFPKGRAEGERGRTIFQLRSFANMLAEGSWVEATIDTAIPDRQPLPKDDLRKMLVPLGPVVVFGSSNFPFAFSTAGGDTASALAAGCPVIVKSHSMHIGTGEMVASAVIKAAKKHNMPEGIFSNLIGSGVTLGATLVKHPLVKAVGFTGSINGGRALFNLASQRPEPIPVFAEMGSINPVVILPEALEKNSNKWATAYANSITLGTGQFCTNPGLLLGIKGEKLNQFMEQLAEEIEKIAPSCMLHPSIKDDFNNGREKIKSQNGVSTIAEYKGEISPNYAPQTILTVNGKTFLENATLSHEVFGPFSIVVQCENDEELERIINKLDGQLTGTILAEPKEIANSNTIIDALQSRVGRLIFNGVPTGVEVCASMIHGGPYPASSDSRFTAVGIHAVKRWVRPFSYQNWPDELLPSALQNLNPLKITRTVNDIITKKSI
ncbi:MULTISPECIES: aldehyde dehydrogenase (NADP(+)) [unclassified Flavobacterium]|jgi:alpha-ketoglutaric semialdehyde dehydrogenase|uniref:aldehyde dehydrogenase (NADP(+)) n=1 Tax=unclassified Flavobacterium TaxID=196869 RepID=UPI00057D22C8|nr:MULTISPECIES: aldehyde dehydrogenase (NADP(+)) [unclassified Flavobacterium]KIA97057.1 aldehyde dehydrogenase [Flavobacterium sp. KMS]MEA9414008.1 aldehyde dehydrogenase (NADP(+)) [Flavobacterium sp. PL02]OUL62418.1 aldehyde dehydrogenase (NADP(+)) [Flavobacterium sp. AJR]